MSPQEAQSLAQFIQDHDTRFTPKAMATDQPEAHVLLKHPHDGGETALHSIAEYESKFIQARDPGPSIKEAWEKWRA